MEEKENLSKLKLKVDSSFPTTKPNENIIRLSCPSCEKPIDMEHININDKIAKCGSCAAVFSFEKEVKNLAQAAEKMEEENIVRPAGVDKSYFHDELELTMKQPTRGTWIFFTVMSAFFAVLFYLVHQKKGIPIYWPSGFGGLVIFFLYKFWNSPNEKVYLYVDEEYLSIQHRPKNFVKDKMIATQEIEQLYTQNMGAQYYRLFAILNTNEGQKHVKLITYIDSRNKARFIEREVEKYLGIEDRRVPEEQMFTRTKSETMWG